jgi:hypothetical protein
MMALGLKWYRAFLASSQDPGFNPQCQKKKIFTNDWVNCGNTISCLCGRQRQRRLWFEVIPGKISMRPYLKNKLESKGLGAREVAECSPSRCKAPHSIPTSTTKGLCLRFHIYSYFSLSLLSIFSSFKKTISKELFVMTATRGLGIVVLVSNASYLRDGNWEDGGSTGCTKKKRTGRRRKKKEKKEKEKKERKREREKEGKKERKKRKKEEEEEEEEEEKKRKK